MALFKKKIRTNNTRHILFWVLIFLYYIISGNLKYYYFRGYWQLIESSLFNILLQIVTAYTCLWYLIPRYLNKGKDIAFMGYIFSLLLIMFICHLLYDVYYYNPKYYYLNETLINAYKNDALWEWITIFSDFISKIIHCFTPTALLLAYLFLKKQQQFLKINEQKKTAELSALKKQLNPHFLFNTLNNLYVLAIEKSDKTPEIIEKLADILDYIIYRCNDKFVFVNKEIELIKNYIDLEKLRYSDRVIINFDNKIQNTTKIAPLLLLTFIENAFKHGVSQEIHIAEINILLHSKGKNILFSISNTKPGIENDNHLKTDAIGLQNIHKQLDLIYPNKHSLIIHNTKETYTVNLKLSKANV